MSASHPPRTLRHIGLSGALGRPTGHSDVTGCTHPLRPPHLRLDEPPAPHSTARTGPALARGPASSRQVAAQDTSRRTAYALAALYQGLFSGLPPNVRAHVAESQASKPIACCRAREALAGASWSVRKWQSRTRSVSTAVALALACPAAPYSQGKGRARNNWKQIDEAAAAFVVCIRNS